MYLLFLLILEYQSQHTTWRSNILLGEGGGEKAEVPTEGTGRSNGIFHSPSFWNQWRDGSRLQLLSQTPNQETLRKEGGTLSHYYYLD